MGGGGGAARAGRGRPRWLGLALGALALVSLGSSAVAAATGGPGFTFDEGPEGWILTGDGGLRQAPVTRRPAEVRGDGGALRFCHGEDEAVALARARFNGEVPAAFAPALRRVRGGRSVDLAGVEAVGFWVRSDRAANLALIAHERDGSQYIRALSLPAGAWQEVRAGLAELSLTGSTEDENHRLDADQVWLLELRDLDVARRGEAAPNCLSLDAMTFEPGGGQGRGRPAAPWVAPAASGRGREATFRGDVAEHVARAGGRIEVRVEDAWFDDGEGLTLAHSFVDPRGEVVRAGRVALDPGDGEPFGVLEAPERPGLYGLAYEVRRGDDVRGRGTAPLGVVAASRRERAPASSPFGTCVVSDFTRTSRAGEDHRYVHALGIRWYRPIVEWHRIEPSRGRFEWEGLDALVDEALDAGLSLAPVVAHVPRWATDGSDRSPPRDPQDFARFMEALAGRYRGRISHWTLGNELNHRSEWPDWDAASHLAYLRAGARGVREADPGALVLLGGVAFMDHAWIEELYDRGGGDAFDVMNLHAYVFPDPPERVAGSRLLRESTGKEASLRGLERVRRTMERHGDGSKPIWITEITWGTGRDRREGVDEKLRPFYVDQLDQARYLVRSHLLALALGVEKVFVLAVPDVSDEPQGIFGLVGLMSADGVPKRSLVAYAAMTALLEGASVERVLRLEGEGPHGVVFRRADADLVALWNPGGPATARLETRRPPARTVDLLGNARPWSGEAAGATVEIGPDPIYVEGPRGFLGAVGF